MSNICEVHMSKTLVAGPWLGEFGWELFMWQARIRYLKAIGCFDQVVCIVRTGHDFLYRDFATDFLFCDLQGEKNGWRLNDQKPSIPSDMRNNLVSKYGDFDIVEPGVLFNYNDQEFISFTHKLEEKWDLVFHCRSSTKLNTAYRNWEIEKWNGLRAAFPQLKIASVGSKDESISIDGTSDLRGIPLDQLAGVLSNSKILIGPSSGTMHFGSLCGCKHIVFSDKRIAFEGKFTNRYRYEIGWNPLNTKAVVIDKEGWRPSLETVIRCVEKEL